MAKLCFFSILLLIICYLDLITSDSSLDQSNLNICKTEECIKSAEHILKSMNQTADPCDDFYQFACGNWTSPPNSTETGTITAIQTLNSNELLDFLKKNNSDDEPNILHKTRNLFQLCKEGGSVKGKRFEIIKNVLKDINLPLSPPLSNETGDFDLTLTMAKIAKTLPTVIPFFGATVYSDPYNQSANVLQFTYDSSDLILSAFTDAHDVDEDLSSYCNVESNVCPLMQEFLNATSNKTVYEKFEKYTEYTRRRDRVKSRSRYINPDTTVRYVITLSELINITNEIALNQSMTPVVNWTHYMEILFEGVENVNYKEADKFRILIPNYAYVNNIIKFLHEESVENHRFGLWFDVVNALITKANTSQTGEKVCYGHIITLFGRPLSYFYFVSPEYKNYRDKSNTTEIVQNIKSVLRELIENSTWIDENTKVKGLHKVDAMATYIGYPTIIEYADELDKAYESMPITNDYFETLLNVHKSILQHRLSHINKPNTLGRDNGYVSPTTVNAYYDPEGNTIYVPAAILHFPMYHNGLQALNYGGIGTIIGHEITHGFDNSGAKYNYKGDLENWWENNTLHKYKQKANCFVKAYENYNISGSRIYMDGNISLGENIADNGGFKEAILGYRKYVNDHGVEPLLPGLEKYTHEQLLTLNYGNLWCQKNAYRNAFFGFFSNHSPQLLRVNVVTANSKYFSNIWNCPVGSKMNPPDKCELW